MIWTSNWLNCDGICYRKYRRVIFCSVENVHPNPAVFILFPSPIWNFDSLKKITKSWVQARQNSWTPPTRSDGHCMSLWRTASFLPFCVFTCHSNRARCGSFGRRWGRPSQRRTGLRWSRFGKHGKDGSLIHDDPRNESKICQAKHVMKSSVFVCLFNDSKSSSALLLLKRLINVTSEVTSDSRFFTCSWRMPSSFKMSVLVALQHSSWKQNPVWHMTHYGATPHVPSFPRFLWEEYTKKIQGRQEVFKPMFLGLYIQLSVPPIQIYLSLLVILHLSLL